MRRVDCTKRLVFADLVSMRRVPSRSPASGAWGGSTMRCEQTGIRSARGGKEGDEPSIFLCTRLARAAEYPFGTDQNLGLPSKKIASIVLHSSLNIKFSIRESKQ
jgi:hypothetical protein